ncbi:hypothetical protein [Streptomyces sp. NPDC058268]|uniref:hypothetical protein n=1 Tax=Streptomyces sp. NPDC058268 TaxID=3346413 RepID=UPI0036EE7274
MSSPAGGHRPGVHKAHYARCRGTKKTRNGYAALTRRLPMGDVACIRATMKHHGKYYVAKYLGC